MARMFRNTIFFTTHVRNSLKRLFLIAVCAALMLASCSSQDATPTALVSPTRSGRLTPYASPSPTSTTAATVIPTSTSTPPAPTPTPITHEVQRGEDMLGIALRYGVGLAELTAANPTVNPNIMSIGTILVIPVSLTPTAAAQVSAEDVVALTPTAIPVLMHPVTCTRARDGGIWCFQALENNQDITLESLTGVFHLRADDGQTRTQKAALPLDTLPPGASLPLSAYFSPEDSAGVTEPFQVTSELYTALPNPDDGRYVPSQPQNQKVFISADGLSAEVTLEVELAADGQQANRVWVAAVAYDENDQVAGLRRWEKQSEQPLVSGETLPVQMQIYSAAGPIQRITVLTEARP